MSAGRYAEIARDLGVRAEAGYPLAKLTTMRVGGPADWVFFPAEIETAAALYTALRDEPLPLRLLGAGSNVIAPDTGLRAAVITTREMGAAPERQPGGLVAAPAGAAIPGLARWASREGLAGLEFAEGIPAQLGGAIRMNAGANRSSFSEIVEEVLVAGPGGTIDRRRPHSNEFSYRDSFVAREGLFALGAVLRLREDDPEAITERMGGFRDRRRSTQPIRERSAGCVFANYPGQPIGRLVEELGLKGLAIGAAEVSELHCNYIVNRGAARAEDVLALIARVAEELTRVTGVTPRLEVQIWSDEA